MWLVRRGYSSLSALVSTPAPLLLVRDALGDGVLDPDHVDAIADVVKKIPAWTPGNTAEIVEKHLVETAGAAHPPVVRSHGEALLARIDPDFDGTQPGEGGG